jgi:hypothetical protein
LTKVLETASEISEKYQLPAANWRSIHCWALGPRSKWGCCILWLLWVQTEGS